MNFRVATLGLMLAAASLAPLRAPATDESQQVRGALPHGGDYVIERDDTIGAAAIDLWFRAPGAGYDNMSPGIARLAATAVTAAPLESGKSLVALVRGVGGRITISAYPDIVGVSATVPAAAARRVVTAMTSAFFSPAFDDASLKTAQRDMAVLGVQKRYSTDQTLHDALFEHLFSGGAAHYSPIPDTVSDLTKITLPEVTKFAARAFRSANSTLALAGNVDASAIEAVTAGTAGTPDAPIDSQRAGEPSANAVVTAAVSGNGLAWFGPPIADEKSATALDFVADYLFRDGTGVVSKTLDPSGDAYVNAQFITLHDPGVMLVTVGGGNAATTAQGVVRAIESLQQPLDDRTFTAARNAFFYHLSSDIQGPQEQADNLGWYASEGNGSYAPSVADSSYWKAAAALDPQFVASVVKRYLVHPVSVQLQIAPSKESAS